uniref:RNA binding motif protein 33 n=1 Tax=Catagonus wagneri TaxID=51154 RepID=A0A8C3W0J2_9CETA
MRVQFQSLALLSGLSIWSCHELWCRSQTRFGSCVAVVVAGSCSSDSTPSLGTSMCCLCDDDFDQFDKPGAERSWRRRAADEDWDSELEDDLLGEDLLTGKKNQSDLSDEELNDDLLQSDNEDEGNFSSQGVTLSLNTTSGMVTSFELSDNTNDQSGEQESEYGQGEDELVYHKSDGSELYAHGYPEEGGQYEGPDAELTEDHMEYVEEPEEGQLYSDEVLDIEINEPLDEFTDEEYLQACGQQGMTEQEDCVAEEELDGISDSQVAPDTEEGSMETLELQKDVKEESDEEDDDDEESGRLRFKTERKEGTIIRLSDVTRERRNIPETLGNFFCLISVFSISSPSSFFLLCLLAQDVPRLSFHVASWSELVQHMFLRKQICEVDLG